MLCSEGSYKRCLQPGVAHRISRSTRGRSVAAEGGEIVAWTLISSAPTSLKHHTKPLNARQVFRRCSTLRRSTRKRCSTRPQIPELNKLYRIHPSTHPPRDAYQAARAGGLVSASRIAKCAAIAEWIGRRQSGAVRGVRGGRVAPPWAPIGSSQRPGGSASTLGTHSRSARWKTANVCSPNWLLKVMSRGLNSGVPRRSRVS